jgi:flagellin-like hook-associated protein FlgL
VTISQLAQGQSTLSGAFASSELALNGGEPFALTIGQAGAVQTLTINPPTPEAIAEALNAAELGLSAELRVLDEATGSVSLVVNGETGVNAAFTLDDPTGELGWATVQNALNSQAEVNGEAQESATNRFELGAGLSIEAKSVGSKETFEVRTRDGFFTVLETFAEGLEANVQQQDRSLAQLESMLENMSLGLARVGTDLSAVERTRDVMAEEQLQTDALISDLRDLDFAEAITKLRADQLALEAAQSSFARIAGQSLFDFLR